MACYLPFRTLNPICKMVYSKRKEFAPIGSKFFPFIVDPFHKGAKAISTKLSLLKRPSQDVGGGGQGNMPIYFQGTREHWKIFKGNKETKLIFGNRKHQIFENHF